MATSDTHPAVMADSGPPFRPGASLLAYPPARLPSAGLPAAAAGKPDQALSPTVDALPPRGWRNHTQRLTIANLSEFV
jgi:hypothetical protein